MLNIPSIKQRGVGEGFGAENELGEGDGEDSKASGGTDSDLKYGDGEGVVGESAKDNACGNGVTSSADLWW